MHGFVLLAIAAFVMTAPASAMTLSQMRALPGGSLIEQRVLQIFNAYGAPTAVVDGVNHPGGLRLVRWHALRMRLDTGAWTLVYRGRAVSVAQGWRNPDPRQPLALAGVEQMEFVARGNAGIVTINAAAHRTTYRVPDDLLLAHKVLAVKARLARPVGLRLIADRYGYGFGSVAGNSGRPVARYWIFTQNHASEDPMPVSLYAVDFTLSRDRQKVTGYAIYGVDMPFVGRRFNAYYIHYIDLFSD